MRGWVIPRDDVVHRRAHKGGTWRGTCCRGARLGDCWGCFLNRHEEKVTGDSFDVIMAAYPTTGQAERDVDTPVRLVKDETVRSEGVILAEHGADGGCR